MSNHEGKPLPIELAQIGLTGLEQNLWKTCADFVRERKSSRILVTGTERGCGTSVLTASIAVNLARHLRYPTVLLGTDFMSPSLATYCGVPGEPGLADVMGGSTELKYALHSAPGLAELSVLPSGGKRVSLAGEFAGEAFKMALSQLSGSAKVVLIDSPPIVTEASTTALLDSVDAVILVTRARVSLKEDVEEARSRIEGAGVHFLGAVLNRFRPEFSRSIG